MFPRSAIGIHAHDKFKTGLRPPKNAPALLVGRAIKRGFKLPPVPASADHFKSVTFGLYENDHFGVCGPTGYCNLTKLVSKGLTGKTVSPSQDDCFTLYRQSGNPDFNPATGADDNGVDLQTMLEAAMEHGVGGVKPICFGKVPTDDRSLNAAVAIFGGVLWGQTLEVSQQTQSSAKPPVWDFHAPHKMWGGHCTMTGKYVGNANLDNEAGADDSTISWKMAIQTTPAYRRHQLQEAWVVVFPWHLKSKEFLQAVDLATLKTDFEGLTGKAFPVSASEVQSLHAKAERDAQAAESDPEPDSDPAE